MTLLYGPYSPSRLETATCPYTFYRQYVDPQNRIIRQEGLPQARGAAVHEILEILTNNMKVHTGDRLWYLGKDDLLKLVTEAVSRHPAAMPEIPDIVKMSEIYMHNPPLFLASDADVEMRMAVKVTSEGAVVPCSYEDPEASVRGRADILSISDDTTIAYLYDHKTQPNKEEADTFQLGVYAWLVSKQYPYLHEIRTILYFARYGKYSGHVIWVRDHDVRNRILSERNDLDPDHVISLTDVEDELYTRIRVIESITAWDAIPYKGCQYCPVKGECPALKGLFEIQSDGRMVVTSPFRILGDTNQAVKAAGYIHILENLVSGLKDELKEHVKMSGPIAIPGKVYCFKTEEAVDWDKFRKLGNVALPIFEKYGVDPSLYQGYNSTFSKKLLYHPNEKFVNELKAILPVKLTSVFKGWKTS